MSEAELRRLRADLETMERAAGLELPFGWGDVALALALVPAGAVLAAWAAWGPDRLLLWALVPVLLPAAASLWLWRRLRRRQEGVAWRREQAFSWAWCLFMGAGMLAYIFWGESRGLPIGTLTGASIYFFGLLCAVLALTGRGRRALLGGALALVPYGMLIPLCGRQEKVILGGCAVMAAGLAAAAIQAGQLVLARRSHESVPH
jgi:hypothetical protein